MSHLVVTIDDKLLGEFPIEKEKVTIGRKADNDICLNNLAISGYHTQIITVLDSSFLEDLNSTNGTYVNARLVKKHALEDGDLIDIGNHRLRYVNGNGEQKPKSDTDVLEKTIVLTPKDTSLQEAKGLRKENTVVEPVKKDPESATPATTEPPPPQAPVVEKTVSSPEVSAGKAGKLQVLNGKNAGLVLDLKKSLTTFGSPKQAVAGVTKRSSGYFLIHVQGNEGYTTQLNGEPLKEKASRLEDHDIIEVSGVKLEFYTE